MMTRSEIASRFKSAKNKREQIKILAALNDCPVSVIQEELIAAGIAPEDVRLRRKKGTKQAEQVKKPAGPSGVKVALDALRKELKQLDEVSEDLLAQICFLQDEYDKVNGKKGKIRKAIEALEEVEG